MDSDTEEELWSWYNTVKKKDSRPQRCGWLQQLREEAKKKKKDNSSNENQDEKNNANTEKVENIENNTTKNNHNTTSRTPLRDQIPSPGIEISPISNTMLTPIMILPHGTDVSSPHNISILSSVDNAFLYSPDDKQRGNTTIDIAASLGAALDDPSTQWTPGLATPAPPANPSIVTPSSEKLNKSIPNYVTNSATTAGYTTPVSRNDSNNSHVNSQLKQKILVRSLFSPNLNESSSCSLGIKKIVDIDKNFEDRKLSLAGESNFFEEFGKQTQVFSICKDDSIFERGIDDLKFKGDGREIRDDSDYNEKEQHGKIAPNFQNNDEIGTNISAESEKCDVSEHQKYRLSSPLKKKRKMDNLKNTDIELKHSLSEIYKDSSKTYNNIQSNMDKKTPEGIDSINSNIIAAHVGQINSHSPPNAPLSKSNHTPLFKSKIADHIKEKYSPKHSNENIPTKNNNSVNKILSKLSRQK
ncbi:unnamed protein product, partial [Meganyctiphanes norvegica]